MHFKERSRGYAAKHYLTTRRKTYVSNYRNRPDVKRREKIRRATPRRLELNRLRVHRYRARKLLVHFLDGDVQMMHLSKIKSLRCFYCGKRLKRWDADHLMPISKGGLHTSFNLVPSCHSCNCAKKDKHPSEFIKKGQLVLVF